MNTRQRKLKTQLVKKILSLKYIQELHVNPVKYIAFDTM